MPQKGILEMGRRLGPDSTCPLGQDGCPHLDEVQRLRAECDHLLQLSITDPLTSLFNYRYLVTTLDQEMERTRRTGLATALIMIDLDHFKRVNDTYGHHAGDKTLQWASRLWRENIRRIDVPCRYGGEEFAIILPGSDLSQAIFVAERLRAVLEESPLSFDSHSIAVTASFGVTAYRGQKSFSVQRLLDCADHMLIRAKVQGRNRVCSAPVGARKPCTEVTSEERAALYSARGRTGAESGSASNDGLQEE